MRESLRFAVAELNGAAGVRHYRLRDGTHICVRHGVTSWTLEEIFRRGAYDPPPEVSRTLERAGGELSLVDLGGHAGTTEFTDDVLSRVGTKIEVWSSLGSR